MEGIMKKSKNERKKAIECWEEFVIARDPPYTGVLSLLFDQNGDSSFSRCSRKS
jgi:hypothetical protein